MTDLSGNRLAEAVRKRSRVVGAVRTPIALERWTIVPPAANTVQALRLAFPRPLDWALLSRSITVTSASGDPVRGRVSVDQCERRWRFTPASPWDAGTHVMDVSPGLEDVCGNTLQAAFDRPLRQGTRLASDVASRSISFQVI